MRFFVCALCLFGLVVPSFETKALTFEQLPVKQASKQWEVQIGKAEAGKRNVSYLCCRNQKHWTRCSFGGNFSLSE